MIKYVILFLFLSSSYALEIVKLNDGRVAYCSDQYDVSKSSRGLIYNVSEAKVWSVYKGKMQILLKVDFYNCVDTDKGPKLYKTKFSNIKKYNFNDQEVSVSYKNSSFRATANGEVLSVSSYKPGDKYIVLTVDTSKLDSSVFNSKRLFSFDIDFKTQASYKSSDYESGWHRVVLGAFRIFI